MSEDTAALVEIAQDIMDTRREHDVCSRIECFYPAVIQMTEGVLALTAALERAERERDEAQGNFRVAKERIRDEEARAQKAERENREMQLALDGKPTGYFVARAQKAERERDGWKEAARKRTEAWSEECAIAERKADAAEALAQKAVAELESIRAALAYPDEPPTEQA